MQRKAMFLGCYRFNIDELHACSWRPFTAKSWVQLHTSLRGATYLLTSRSRVLIEKLTGLQLVKKFPAFYGTRRFITAFTSARYLSLSWASSIQSILRHPTSWRSDLMLSSHLRLGLHSGLFPSDFPTKPLYTSLRSPIRATFPSHLRHGEVSLGDDFVPVPRFSPVSVIPLVLHVNFSITCALQSQKLSEPSHETHFRVSVIRCRKFSAQ
jgi:hypothetical protein